MEFKIDFHYFQVGWVVGWVGGWLENWRVMLISAFKVEVEVEVEAELGNKTLPLWNCPGIRLWPNMIVQL